MNAKTPILTLIPVLALVISGAVDAKGKPPGSGGGGSGNVEYPLIVVLCDTAHMVGDDVDIVSDPECGIASGTRYVHGELGVRAVIRANCNLNFAPMDRGSERSNNVIYDAIDEVPKLEHINIGATINTHPRDEISLKLGDMSEGQSGITGGGVRWGVEGARKKDDVTYQNVYNQECFDLNIPVPGTTMSVSRPFADTWILEGTRTNLCIRGRTDVYYPDVGLSFRAILRCVDPANCPEPGTAVQCNP